MIDNALVWTIGVGFERLEVDEAAAGRMRAHAHPSQHPSALKGRVMRRDARCADGVIAKCGRTLARRGGGLIYISIDERWIAHHCGFGQGLPRRSG